MFFSLGLAVLCLLRPSRQVGQAYTGLRSFRIDKLGVWLSLYFLIHIVGLQKAEADYTLDESFWNEESPMGEVERLLREYRQNQELVRNIGAHYYQIIYPVQLRHHEKMGISTREVGAQKFPSRESGEGGGYQQGTGNTSRARSRTGKHFHRTSLLIKAFNHKFRLDLELNTQLLAPNLMQKHFLANGAEQVTKQEIEHCYYHGTVKDYPGATAAFHTCNGVSGVIHVGNETFVIHPFYGGDLSKHPHVIFEARTKANKGCALSGNLEWPNAYRRPKHISGLAPDRRMKRDVLEATKYIETALVIDKAMFEKRNGSTRSEVVHDAIQVANIADLYFRTLNTRVSIVYIETWQGSNQALIDKSEDISRALLNFNDYTSRKLYRVEKDTAQLLTGVMFKGGEAGMSVPETVCTDKSVGISVDVNAYELHLLAGTMAHMIGHNIGMGHDGGREECFCRDWHGCIMAQSIVGLENVQPYKFSECSRVDYNSALRTGHGLCLLNKPNQLEVRRSCGNRVIEEGEDCDCGLIQECQENDPCCDPYTCKLKKESECATGECCVECKLKPMGVECRPATNECDLPEHCNGEDGQCPPDFHKKNGISCDSGKGYCFNGICPTLDIQCKQIWGYSAKAGDAECFKQFNPKGSFSGHCGTDSDKQYIKCDNENALCGSLQCQLGSGYPVSAGVDQLFSRTIISMKGVEYECKTTSGPMEQPDLPEAGLVRDGTPCGAQLVCVNQTCTSIFPFISTVKCPMNHNSLECSKHGTCNNANKCHCEPGWTGPDCSIQVEIMNTPPPDGTQAPGENKEPSLEGQMKKKETPYGRDHENLSTLAMVFIMVGVVKGVFICFALIAVCYRRTTMPKPEPPYSKKPMSKGFSSSSLATPEEAAGLDASKMPPFNNMPGYSGRGDSQRVLFRPNHMGAGPPTSRFQDHKMQQIKRFAGSGSEDDPGHSGEEETVSFIDLPPNNLAKLPEKGILKKPCPYGGEDTCHKKWLEDAGADPQEILDNSLTLGPDMISTGPSSEVERTLKSLNGYHEDILEALRSAASRHSGASSEDLLRRSLAAAAASLDPCPAYNRVNSQDKLCSDQSHGSQTHVVMVENSSPSPSGHHHHRRTNHRTENQDDEEEEELPPSGPIRIRNLEDLIRQLEHKTTRHMSPSGSEDIRMSETEADRHYNRLDPQSGRVRSSSDFVYSRYRHGTGRGAGYLPEEEGIYESADQDRVSVQPREAPYNADTPDSESDDFIQAQQRLHRSASDEEEEDGGEVRVEGDSSQREDSPSPSNDQSALIPPGPKYPEYKH